MYYLVSVVIVLCQLTPFDFPKALGPVKPRTLDTGLSQINS